MMNANATGEQTVVIVGAGLGGGNAAVTFREEGWRGRIVLLGAEPGIPFGRPPLSKTYLRGEEDLSAWLVKPADWYGEHDVELRTGSTVRYEYIYSFWSDQYEHNLEYVGFARKWERIVLRGDYNSRKFLAFYLTQGILQAAFGLNRGGDPELDPDAELRTCQDLIRGRIQLSEAALADDHVDLRSLNTTP